MKKMADLETPTASPSATPAPTAALTSDPQNIQDLTAFVGTLLGQMQERFQQMSDQIVSRIDDMGGRIDDLEENIGDLMTQAGMDGPEK